MKLSLGEGEAESCSANTASRLDLNLAAASRIVTALGGPSYSFSELLLLPAALLVSV